MKTNYNQFLKSYKKWHPQQTKDGTARKMADLIWIKLRNDHGVPSSNHKITFKDFGDEFHGKK